MSSRKKLVQEIAQAPDVLIEKFLDFLLFAKTRRNLQSRSEVPQEPRPWGLCAGKFTVPPDFNDSLPEDILQDFEENLL